jgi:hypothetical protein
VKGLSSNIPASRAEEELRSRLLEGKRPFQAAEPVDRQRGEVMPVTAAELEAVLTRLREVRALPLA